MVGGAAKGKAIIVLNPAEPPLMMRDTVYVLSDEASQDDIEASINEMAEAVQAYVPGYRLKQRSLKLSRRINRLICRAWVSSPG